MSLQTSIIATMSSGVMLMPGGPPINQSVA